MKVVSPEAREATGGTRTLTQTFQALLPNSVEFVDLGALFLLAAIAFVGFHDTFDSWQFYFVALLGVVLGVFASRLAYVLGWHWLLVVPLVLAEFFLVGSALAFRDEAAFSALPTLESLRSLGQLSLGGWKELLTTLPPVDGAGPFVGLPYIMGLVYGAIALPATRLRRPFVALLPPVALLIAVVLLGTMRATFATPVGLAFAALAFAWAAWRFRQRRRLVSSGRSDRTQLALGVSMLAAALAGGFLLAGFLPGGNVPRVVLRSFVQPPVELGDYASPLVGFRQYSSKQLKRFHDKELLKVTGVPDGALLRMGVMDDYSGITWTATSGAGGDGFQRLGASIPDVTADGMPTLQVTVLAGYADPKGSLAMWIPSLGETASVTFEGARARNHEAGFRYNLSSQQGIVVDRLQTDDQVTVVTQPYPTAPTGDAAPVGSPNIPAERSDFLTQPGQKYLGAGEDPWAKLTALASAFKNGAWSDGTAGGEAQYLPGHGARRLVNFLSGPTLVGSDEQYAATFALLATQLGYPTRVVMGAQVPAGGLVTGADIHAWVEVQTASGWVTVPPSAFIPDRTKTPDQTPQPVTIEPHATNVPPPNPVRAPGSIEDLSEGQLSGLTTDSDSGPSIWDRILGILVIVGPPVGGIALILGAIAAAKAVRSARRRASGAPAHRVAQGWRDVIDQARDMGIKVPAGATRLEQSRLMLAPAASVLAAQANTLVLGPEPPAASDVDEFWRGAKSTKASMRGALNLRRRFAARFSPRSLLPERASAGTAGVTGKADRRATSKPKKTRGRSQG